MATIPKSIDAEMREHRESIKKLKALKEIAAELPEFIRGMDGEVTYLSSYDASLHIRLLKSETLEDELEQHGLFLRRILDNWGSWNGTTETKCDSGRIVRIEVWGMDGAPNCRIEKYQDTITRYRSVCEEEPRFEEEK